MIKPIHIHNDTAYEIIRVKPMDRFFDKEQRVIKENVKLYRDWLGCDHVLQNATHGRMWKKNKKMNRVTIKYDLDNKHESVAFERAIRSTDLALILWEILKNRKTAVTNKINSANVELSAHDGAELVYDEIYELLRQYEIDIDKLIK
jgi:hypothetical protein